MNKVLIIDADSLCYSASSETLAQSIEYLESNIKTIINNCNWHNDLTHFAIFLTGSNKDYFRYKIYPDYKANRKNKVHPEFVLYLKKYLINNYCAQRFTTMEADDACSILAHKLLTNGDSYITAHIDGDLDQIVGDHYNYKHNTFYTTSREESDKALFKQILIGKSKDNTKGIKNFGIKAWEKYQEDIKDLNDVKLLFNSYESKKDTFAFETNELALEAFELNYKLCKLLTDEIVCDDQEVPVMHELNKLSLAQIPVPNDIF